MHFDNIKVIQDTHGMLASKKIQIKDAYCFLEPTDIQDAEGFEKQLKKCGIPYVLAQVETQLPNPLRYKRGYAIFTEITKETALEKTLDAVFGEEKSDEDAL